MLPEDEHYRWERGFAPSCSSTASACYQIKQTRRAGSDAEERDSRVFWLGRHTMMMSSTNTTSEWSCSDSDSRTGSRWRHGRAAEVFARRIGSRRPKDPGKPDGGVRRTLNRWPRTQQSWCCGRFRQPTIPGVSRSKAPSCGSTARLAPPTTRLDQAPGSVLPVLRPDSEPMDSRVLLGASPYPAAREDPGKNQKKSEKAGWGRPGRPDCWITACCRRALTSACRTFSVFFSRPLLTRPPPPASVAATLLLFFLLQLSLPARGQLRGLLGEYYELDYDAEDLPCNLDSLEDAFLGQVPHVQTTESDGLEIEKLTPANCMPTSLLRLGYCNYL